MTRDTKLMSGIILLTVPTIQYGGYFLLQLLSGKMRGLALTDFQRAMFRAGHAHAGVLILLALIVQLLLDEVVLSGGLKWVVRSLIPAAAILMSGGFFAAAVGPGRTEPGGGIVLLYIGAAVLAVGVLAAGGLLVFRR